MGLVLLLLRLSSPPLPAERPVFELRVDACDLFSLLDCADVLARRGYARVAPLLPAPCQKSIGEVLDFGGHGGIG